MNSIYLFQNNSEISTALWTAVFTLIGGLILVILQKLFLDLIYSPISKHREIVAKIAVDLIKYAKFYANPIVYNDITKIDNGRSEIETRDYEMASDKTRELSAILKISTENIPIYRFLLHINLIKIKKEASIEASTLLMQLSNSYFHGNGIHNSKIADKIKELLKIPTS